MEKVFFNKGDIVRLKNMDSPEMLVVEVKMESRFNSDDSLDPVKRRGMMLDGIVCLWFDNVGHVQEYKWNTKDLEKIKGNDE